MIEILKNSPVVWAVLAICSLIGVPSFIFTVVTWIKGKKKKRFSMAKTKYQLIRKGKNEIDKLKLLYDDSEIEDLTITKIAIWNSGNREIRREDIATERPLRIISTGEANILDIRIITQSDPTNKFSIKSANDKEAVIDFEYVNDRDGIVLQILHSGSYSDITFDCKIKGGCEIRRGKRSNAKNWIIKKIREIKNFDIILAGVECGLLSICLVLVGLQEFGVIPRNWPADPVEEMAKHPDIKVLILIGCLMFVLVGMFISIIRVRLHLDIPEALRPSIEIEDSIM